MPFFRTLILILVVGLIFVLARQLYRNSQKRARDDVEADKRLAVNTVRCAHCGVHLPKAEALTAAGRYYCCARHRDARTDD